MGARGPVPKRSEERIRRNEPEIPITKIEAAGVVEAPELDFPDPHPMIVDFWEAIVSSAQAEYYEPSDYEFARFTLHFADQLLKSSRPSAQMLQGINSALSDLLVSEGARRRVRMEVERQKTNAAVVDISEMFKERMGET